MKNIDKSLQNAPKLQKDNLNNIATIKKWLFGKKKTIWDYIQDTNIDSSIREEVYYFMYGAIIIIDAYKDDPSWNNTIKYLNYVYGIIMVNFENKNYSAIQRVLKEKFVQTVIKYGKKWAKEDGKQFPF